MTLRDGPVSGQSLGRRRLQEVQSAPDESFIGQTLAEVASLANQIARLAERIDAVDNNTDVSGNENGHLTYSGAKSILTNETGDVLERGTVVAFDPVNESSFVYAASDGDDSVIGTVWNDKFSAAGNAVEIGGTAQICHLGRTNIKVWGAVTKDDYLIADGTNNGYAKTAADKYAVGVFARAEETIGATGTIKALVWPPTVGQLWEYTGGVYKNTISAPVELYTNSSTAGLRLYGADATKEIADFFVTSLGALIIDLRSGSDTDAHFEFKSEDDKYGILIRGSSGADNSAYANLYTTGVPGVDDYFSINLSSRQDTDCFVLTQSDRAGIGRIPTTHKFEVNGNVWLFNDNDTLLFGADEDVEMSFDGAGFEMVVNALTGLRVQNDGTIQSGVANYETLVVADDDIPNKKYVDDTIATAAAWLSSRKQRTIPRHSPKT